MENGEKGRAPSLDDVMRAVLPEDMPMHPDHPMQQAEPAPSKYSDVVSDGGMDPRNAPAPALSYKDDPRTPVELSNAGCRCVRFGEGNPHWPCRIHAAPAQDERDAPEVVAIPCCSKDGDWYIDALHPSRLGEHGYLAEGDELMTVAQHERIIAALTRPAQTEQQPSSWKLVPVELTQEMNDAGRKLLAQGSVPMSKVFRAILDAAPIAQTEQLPEQSGLADLPYQTLFNAIAAATDAGDSPVSISVKAFRAALSAQGGEA